MTKEQEIMEYLHKNVFDPILDSPNASNELKQGVRYTIMRMNEREAVQMVRYFWSAVTGTEKSVGFAKKMKDEGFNRFEECIEEFRERFNDAWFRS